ncbi:autotransporter-associated beta strand repeat-containing protein [Saccharicrinis sp. FJH54]|uniref:autotransporter-associated beta strand repeat-containing protein n=1 Tax=Saccharicrinis sp. FJH54 TaxID=3344665 RepID=UPI0035D4611C
MKLSLRFFKLSTLFLFVLAGFSAEAQLPAFPGAEGFGKYASGGRTGTVYHVTNLSDSGTGSFRDAVSRSNRIIVFDVAGVIRINSTIVVSSNLYIAGQTAPGEGVTIYGDRVSFTGADNTICRYVRFRMGVVGSSGKDALGIANGKNMMFDHISVSWGRDETFSINWDGKGTEPTNITIMNSIISQGLLLHSAGGLIQTGGGVTLYRNLYVDNSTRNNKVKGVSQYVNNVVYNWKNGAYIMGGDSEGSSYVNVNGNYFIKGPDMGGTPISDGNSDFHIYADDNWHDKNLDGVLNGYEIPFSEYSGGPDFQAEPFDYPVLPTIAATALVDDLLPVVGASLPYRDLADYYVVNEVKSFGVEGELISSESTLPIGAPSSWYLWPGIARTDTDKDGMPDAWEDANGTSKTVNDAMTIAANGYTNIENYINGIDASSSQEYIRTPLKFAVKSATQNSITFEWLDYTEKEDGYILQRKIDGAFVNIDTADAGSSTFTLEGLEPEESGVFRIFGYNENTVSGFSNELTAKSRPVEVPVVNPETYAPDLIWRGQVDNNWDKATMNWFDGSGDAAFADDKMVIFGDTVTGNRNVSIDEVVSPAVTFISSDYDYTFTGSGNISGSGSVNKTGSGTFAISTANTYTGATVVWDGTLIINKLSNGGVASGLGASQNYAFNWVMKGGAVHYVGGSTSTDRNITLDETAELGINSSGATVTLNGTLNGAGGFVKSGDGTLKLYNEIGNNYEGDTYIKGGTVSVDLKQKTDVSQVLGSSNKIYLNGGTLELTNGQSSNYEEYNFELIVPEGTSGGFAPYRNCYIKSKVSGSGTLTYTIPYLREYVQGDWSEFTGVLNAYGSNPTNSGGSQLMLNNTVGLPYARVNLSGNAKVINWATTGTMHLGGLSGVSGTVLGAASKQTDGTKMTWIVGGSSTDETFNGIINNDCSANGHYGVTYIEKEGTGIWRLNSNNTYGGTTTVHDGTLIVNGTQSSTASTYVRGGVLAGKGRLYGMVYVYEGGAIAPGDNSISTFRLARLVLNDGSACNFEINADNNSSDKVYSYGSVSYNGTLNLTITGELSIGDQFTLFNGTSHSGSFDDIVPAVPGEGLAWDFSDGVLSVVYPQAIDDVKTEAVSVYPNPAKDLLHIKTDKAYKQLLVTVHNLAGQVMMQQQVDGNSDQNISLSGLASGCYTVDIVADHKIIGKQKLVKE